MFDIVLVANRGECAVRIIRTLQRMNIHAVAIYTKDDKSCRHVRLGDSAYEISDYNDIAEIMKVVRRSKAKAIHPGWGFKSEDPNFPKECARKGVVFIGPNDEVMRNAGNKETCRGIAEELEIPIIPGSPSDVRKRRSLKKWAKDNGLSDLEDSVVFMLKAAAGAGGGGNEIIYSLGEFDDVARRIAGRARRFWKNQRVFLERYIEGGRHIEVQFVRYLDPEGNSYILLLGTRDCSVQWQHQKIVEIAPAPNVTNDQEAKLYAYTELLAERMNYVGVGTVEYLIDSDGVICFLEINPRLQVEHGISELITGYDLVEFGVRVALGEMLPVSRGDVQINGYAVEVRVNTQTIHPDDHKTPIATAGMITGVILPNGGFVRVDHALNVEYLVNMDFNPTQAKIMAWGATYEEAVQHVIEALRETRIEGVETNISLLLQILADPTFQRGEHDTTFLPGLLERIAESGEFLPDNTQKERIAAAAVAVALALKRQERVPPFPSSSEWRDMGRWQQMAGLSFAGRRRW